MSRRKRRKFHLDDELWHWILGHGTVTIWDPEENKTVVYTNDIRAIPYSPLQPNGQQWPYGYGHPITPGWVKEYAKVKLRKVPM